jgi:hypothetical protein
MAACTERQQKSWNDGRVEENERKGNDGREECYDSARPSADEKGGGFR